MGKTDLSQAGGKRYEADVQTALHWARLLNGIITGSSAVSYYANEHDERFDSLQDEIGPPKDIDIVVGPQSPHGVLAALRDMGYRWRDAGRPVDPASDGTRQGVLVSDGHPELDIIRAKTREGFENMRDGSVVKASRLLTEYREAASEEPNASKNYGHKQAILGASSGASAPSTPVHGLSARFRGDGDEDSPPPSMRSLFGGGRRRKRRRTRKRRPSRKRRGVRSRRRRSAAARRKRLKRRTRRRR